MNWFGRMALLIAVVALTGCSTLGVYDNEFACSTGYNGRCVSLPESYELAKSGKDGPEHDPATREEYKKKKADKGDDKNGPQVAKSGEETAHVTYKESLYKRLDGLLKEPATPVVAPPKVMRVLLLPYKGDANELYMLRHVYFFVDEPRWVLGDSLAAMGED